MKLGLVLGLLTVGIKESKTMKIGKFEAHFNFDMKGLMFGVAKEGKYLFFCFGPLCATLETIR